MSRHSRAIAPHKPWRRDGIAAEARALREAAQQRYTEVDLVVAALKDHIRDLQIERERLLAQVAQLQDEADRSAAAWMWRGQKPVR